MARGALSRLVRQISYFYRGGGLLAVWAEVWRKLLSPVYRRDRSQLRISEVRSAAVEERLSAPSANDLRVFVPDSEEDWRQLDLEILSGLRYSRGDLESMEKRGFLLFLAVRQEKGHRPGEVVGYSLTERNVVYAFGERRPVATDLLFSYFTEVHPDYRDRRIQAQLARERALYCRRHGIALRCAWAGERNRPVLAARKRSRGTFREIAELEEVSIMAGSFDATRPGKRSRRPSRGRREPRTTPASALLRPAATLVGGRPCHSLCNASTGLTRDALRAGR